EEKIGRQALSESHTAQGLHERRERGVDELAAIGKNPSEELDLAGVDEQIDQGAADGERRQAGTGPQGAGIEILRHVGFLDPEEITGRRRDEDKETGGGEDINRDGVISPSRNTETKMLDLLLDGGDLGQENDNDTEEERRVGSQIGR